jgi:hypothetical protein
MPEKSPEREGVIPVSFISLEKTIETCCVNDSF